jgi:hypothetical protein
VQRVSLLLACCLVACGSPPGPLVGAGPLDLPHPAPDAQDATVQPPRSSSATDGDTLLPRTPPLLVIASVCTRCTFFSVTRIEVRADGSTEICDFGDRRWIGAATPDELEAIQAVLSSPAWRALEPGPSELSERRFDLFRTTDRKVVRRNDEALRDPVLGPLMERVGTITRRATPLARPRPPATWPRCAGIGDGTR